MIPGRAFDTPTPGTLQQDRAIAFGIWQPIVMVMPVGVDGPTASRARVGCCRNIQDRSRP